MTDVAWLGQRRIAIGIAGSNGTEKSPLVRAAGDADLVGQNRSWATKVSAPLGIPEPLTLSWQVLSIETSGSSRISAPTATVVR